MAWRGLDLPAAWSVAESLEDAQGLFSSRFGLPPGAKVRPVQEAAVELARSMDEPGLMVVEAPMGEGKTEAALAVAEIFAARSGAGGVFFALPTMATGNAMFPRLLEWLKRLPAQEGTRHSVLLAHSKAALNEDFADLMRGTHRLSAVDVDASPTRPWRPSDSSRAAPADLVAHAWLRGRKKAMLASFVTGTVDQLLFAGLKSKHLALRHLAVAGKVVVIDEAHAYDAYMSVYLDRVLSWLGAYRVPVVVLSATLPAGRRRELVEAYAGAGGQGAATEAEFDVVAQAGEYPLLTAVAPRGLPVMRRPAASGRGAPVRLERLDDGGEVLADRLAEELDGGGCALVVRNTVKRVLETARVLRARFGDESVTVAHSCFIDVDRAAKDAALLRRFGPPGKATDRPTGPHIVVASQVAEQSLDVDFDVLVTDLCPVDLLLQRMGRLHRHQRGEGQATGRRGCVRRVASSPALTGMRMRPAPVRGSVAVYGAHALLSLCCGSAVPPRRRGESSGPAAGGHQSAGAERVRRGSGRTGWDGPALSKAAAQHEKQRADQADRAVTFRLGEVGRGGQAPVRMGGRRRRGRGRHPGRPGPGPRQPRKPGGGRRAAARRRCADHCAVARCGPSGQAARRAGTASGPSPGTARRPCSGKQRAASSDPVLDTPRRWTRPSRSLRNCMCLLGR
ncbi:hypothetical protein SBADM41S_03765 [Streptomyces badius]